MNIKVILNKILKDTKNGKLIWYKNHSLYYAKFDITDNKFIRFIIRNDFKKGFYHKCMVINYFNGNEYYELMKLYASKYKKINQIENMVIDELILNEKIEN